MVLCICFDRDTIHLHQAEINLPSTDQSEPSRPIALRMVKVKPSVQSTVQVFIQGHLKGLNMETTVFVTRLTPPTREGLRRQAFANGRTMAGEARVIIEDALGVDRSRVVTPPQKKQNGGR